MIIDGIIIPQNKILKILCFLLLTLKKYPVYSI